VTHEPLVEAVLAGDVGAVARARQQGVLPAVAAGVHARLTALAAPGAAAGDGWWMAQHAVRALGDVVEAGERELAKALLDAVVAQGARPEVLHVEVASWLVEQCPQAVGAHLGRGVRGDLVNLAEAVFMLPGPVGVEWFLVMVRAGWGLRMMADMRDVAAPPQLRTSSVRWPDDWTWSAEDWNAKLEALADAGLPLAPRVLFGLLAWGAPVLPPAETSAAQVRCAVAYCHGPLAGLLDACAGHLAAYRTGRADDDAALIWWQCRSRDQLERLGEILGAAGPAEWRDAVTAAAVADGRIPGEHAAFLLEHADHPQARDAAWEIERLDELAVLPSGDGGVWMGDLFAGDGATGCTVALAGSPVTVWGVVAGNPRYAHPAVQALDLMASADPVARWEPLDLGGAAGLRCQASRVSLGPAGTPGVFRGYPFGAELLRDLALHMPAPTTTDTPAGPVVSFDLPAPHRPVRAWAGRRADGEAVRVVVDLGLDLDPPGEPLPWELAAVTGR